MVDPVNATGWSNLINGKLVEASYELYNSAPFLGGWAVAILFMVFQFMLYIKTRNLIMMWVTGIFFASMYLTSVFVVDFSRNIIVSILILELTGILYYIFFK